MHEALRLFILLYAMVVTDCSKEAPQPSATSAEIAALERQLAAPPSPQNRAAPGAEIPVPPAAPDAPSAPPAATPTEAETFASDAAAATTFLAQQLPAAVAAGRQLQFESDVRTADAHILRLRARATAAAEKNVALLLAAVLAHDKYLHQITLLKTQHPLRQVLVDVRTLERLAGQCRSELVVWLAATPQPGGAVEEGQCLRQAQRGRQEYRPLISSPEWRNLAAGRYNGYGFFSLQLAEVTADAYHPQCFGEGAGLRERYIACIDEIMAERWRNQLRLRAGRLFEQDPHFPESWRTYITIEGEIHALLRLQMDPWCGGKRVPSGTNAFRRAGRDDEMSPLAEIVVPKKWRALCGGLADLSIVPMVGTWTLSEPLIVDLPPS